MMEQTQYQEPKHCRYVDESRATALDGYWCTRINQHVEWCDTRDLCKWPSGSERCPFCTGQPILTEDIARKIYSAFDRNVDRAREAINTMAYELSEIARRTSMESIEHVCEQLKGYYMSLPDANGIYHKNLNLRSEERVAADLEGSLNHSMGYLRDITLTLFGLSGEPVVSSEDFDRVSTCLVTYGGQAEQRMSDYSVGLPAREAHFEEPARQLAVQCSCEISNMIQYVLSDAMSAQTRFNSALNSAQSAARTGLGPVLGSASFNWSFEDGGW